MNISDVLYHFLGSIAIGVLIFVAITLNDLVNLFREWVERR